MPRQSRYAVPIAALALLTLGSTAGAHRSGCHRWHACPSDTGSYVCGDLGDVSQCPATTVTPPAQTRTAPPKPKPLPSAPTSASSGNPTPVRPDPRLSPGDVLTTDTKLICTSGYTKTVRNVPESLKEQVYKLYGITSRAPRSYEIDHVISLELGGSNSIRNLFPEAYNMPLGARVKDELENKLHSLVCSGQLPIEMAQREIVTDWVAAYQKYIGPLPGAK